MAGKKILLIDADVASRNFVARALQHSYTIFHAGSGREGLIAAWRDRPDIIIIDPILSDIKGEDLAAKLRQDQRTVNVLLIALSGDSTAARAKQCLAAGFNEYIVKSGQALAALNAALNRLLGFSALTSKVGGLLIPFVSAKGGAGTSSLCANVAMNMAANQPEARVVVLDMVLPIGSIASIVGYTGELNLVTMTDMAALDINENYLRENLKQTPSWRFHLLAGSPDPESDNHMNVARIGDIIQALKETYDYVVIDLGRSITKTNLPLIQTADLVVLVTSTDLSAITLTKTISEYLRAKGVNPASMFTILNRAVGLEGLSKVEAEKILEFEIKSTMPYMGSGFAQACHQHIPISVKFPKETAATVLKDAASQIAELARKARGK